MGLLLLISGFRPNSRTQQWDPEPPAKVPEVLFGPWRQAFEMFASQISRESGVRVRGEVFQALFGSIRKAKFAYELAHTCRIDALTPCQILETLIRVIHALGAGNRFGTHHGLDSFAQYFPVGLEVSFKRVFGHIQLAHATSDVTDGKYRVTKRSTDVALRGRISQVALPTRLDQRGTQRVQQRVRKFEVGFRIFEPDRVDLMRHRRRTGRTRHWDLGEVADRDVAPHINTETVQDLVEPSDVIEEF